MPALTAEAILNLAWAALCVSALAAHLAKERRPNFHRTVCVLIAAIALFPIVSASDDRMVLAALLGPSSTQSASISSGHWQKTSPSSSSEDPEHGQAIEPTLFSNVPPSAFVIRPESPLQLVSGGSYSPQGRAPPLAPRNA